MRVDERVYHHCGRCFYCGEKIKPGTDLIYWDASYSWQKNRPPTIILHIDCAKTLGCHLIKDAIEPTPPEGRL